MEERRRERESTLCLVVGQNKNSLRGTRCVRFYKNNHCLWAVVPDAFRQRSGFQAIKAHRSMFNTVIKLGDDYAFTITSETWVIWLYGNNEDRGVEQKIFSVIVAPPDSPYTKPQVGHLSEIYSGFLNAKRPLDDRGHPTGTIPGPSPTFSYPQHTLQTSLALEVGAAATNQSIQNPCFWDGASAIVPGNPVPSVAPEAGIMLTSYPGLEPPPDQDYGQQSYHYYGANFGLHGFGSGST